AEMKVAFARGSVLDARWHVRRDGARFWADGETMALRDEETGAVEGYLKILRDLTSRREEEEERRRVEAALRESEARFRHMADSAPALIWMTDASGEICFTNMHYEFLFDKTTQDILGEGWKSIVLPEDVEMLERSFRAAFEARKSFNTEVRVRDRHGEIRWLRCDGVPRLDDYGTFLGYTGCNIDITEARAAVNALRESEQRLRLAMDAGQMAIWESRGATGEIKSSPELNKLLGFAPDQEVTSEMIRARYSPGERERMREIAFAAFARGDSFAQAEVRCEWDDQVRWLLLRGEIDYGDGSHPPDVFGVALDITERKRAEEHLMMLNHELNHRVKNSLATVQAIALQTLRDSETLAQARKAFTSRLVALAKAHDLLTNSNWGGADLSDVVAGIVEAHEGERPRFAVSGPTISLPPKLALSLSMALHELATNAVKYGALSNDSGCVEITWSIAAEEDGRRLHLRWRESGGPPVGPPTRKGFGSRLIERSLAAEVSGVAHIAYEPSGVVCTFDAPMRALAVR
ncbi:MAG: signal transduction histidine kinase, partial [Hyphomicrobiales bacterium]|nr:signal transduction histidine kinase [Hyphomicrobiales bacterium]